MAHRKFKVGDRVIVAPNSLLSCGEEAILSFPRSGGFGILRAYLSEGNYSVDEGSGYPIRGGGVGEAYLELAASAPREQIDPPDAPTAPTLWFSIGPLKVYKHR